MKKILAFLCFSLALAVGGAALADNVNVALNGTAFVNGPLYVGAPFNIAQLIDGDRADVIHGDIALPLGFAYTVDLGTNYAVNEIRIYPRQDGQVPERLTNIRVSVHSDDGTGNIGTELWGTNMFTDGSNAGSGAGKVVSIVPPTPANGRWLEVQTLTNAVPDYSLQMTELEAYANVPAAAVNRAAGAAVTATGPLGTGTTAQLVDGDHYHAIYAGLAPATGFAYLINMGAPVALSKIIVWPRQDSLYPERLANYRVSVHTDNNGQLGAMVWKADLHTDGSNAGSDPGSKDVLTAALDAADANNFQGQWIRIQALDSTVPDNALQISEVQAFGAVTTTAPALLISQQPADAKVDIGQTNTFSIVAKALNGSSTNITYQWQRTGTNLVGATNSTYTIGPIAPGDNGVVYRCVVSYPGLTSVTSAAATVRINWAFHAGAFSNGPLWSSAWNISMLVDGDRGSVFHGIAGPAVGFAYQVNLGTTIQMSEIDLYPRQDGCCPERLTNFRVSVHSDNGGKIGPTVWSADLFTDGSNPGSTAGSLVTLNAGLNPSGTFSGQWIQIETLDNPPPDYALQMDELEVYGNLTTTAPSLSITQQPVSGVAGLGGTNTFSLGVKLINGDAGLLTYQWQRNGTNIAGATNASYTTPILAASDDGASYRCVASYPGLATLVSAAVTLRVDLAYHAVAYANGPFWSGQPGWNVGMLVDGDINGYFHGDVSPPVGFAYQVNLGVPVQMSEIDIYPRQDGAVPERFTNLRVSVHNDNNGQMGATVWSADLFTDGSNPGSKAGTVVVLTNGLNPSGVFTGQWIQIESLDNPPPDYALQMDEMEVFGKFVGTTAVAQIFQQPKDAVTAPLRTAAFSVGARAVNGAQTNVTYQWQKGGVSIPGATASSYVTPPLAAADAGAQFTCLVGFPGTTNVTSAAAQIVFDYNYAKGQPAFASTPLWSSAWNISMLVDGDTNSVFHAIAGPPVGAAYQVNMGLTVNIDHINIFPRQDGCCPERLTNFRVSVHSDNAGTMGPTVWSADMFTDHTNPGSAAGSLVTLTSSLDATGVFAGQWVEIRSLDNPPPDYALQMTELQVIGVAVAPPSLPVLAFTHVGSALTLTWTDPSAVLQANGNVANAAGWTNVPAGNLSPFSTTIRATGATFYRLKR